NVTGVQTCALPIFGGGCAPLGEEGPVGQDPVDHAELGEPRGAQADADGACTLADVRLLDQSERGGIGDVVDAGGAHALVDAALRGGVGLGAAVPVEAVVADVEHRGGLAGQVLGPVHVGA